MRRSSDWLVDEQAVGGLAAVAGDARAAARGDRGTGGGVDSVGGGKETCVNRARTPDPF